MRRAKKILLIVMAFILIIFGTLFFYNRKYNYAEAVDISQLKDKVMAVDIAELDYVSNDRVVFHYTYGLFVYDLKNKKIHRAIDLSKIDSNHINGSNYTQVLVSKDGNTVYIDNIGDGLDDFMYEYNIKMNLLRKVKYKEIKDQDRYIPKLTSTSLTNRGLYSACYGIIDNNINVYLYTKNEKMKDLQILLHNSKNNTDLYYYIFEELQ